MFDYSSEEWSHLVVNSSDKASLLCLLTNFQRHIRHLTCQELLSVAEKCAKLGIRENSEGIDVMYVLLCEILHRFLHENERALPISGISRLCRLMLGLKFNRQADGAAVVPICSANFEAAKDAAACASCRRRYRELLSLTGSDLASVLMAVLGRSLLSQSRELRHLHENLAVPYLVLVGSRNCVMCAHIVRDICSVYRSQFIASRSIRSIAIMLHTVKRTGARASGLAKRVVARLLRPGELEALLDNEPSVRARLAAIAQLIQFCVNTHYSGSRFTRELDCLLRRLVGYARRMFESGAAGDVADYPNFVSQMSLLRRAAQVERTRLKSALGAADARFLARLDGLKPAFAPNEFRTSNTHVQVDAVLRAFNYETALEHYVPPYVVDIFVPSRNAVVEVDGPYHYATGANER